MNVLKSLFLILLFISSQPSLSQLRIEITGGAEDPINIAVVPIDWKLEFPQEEYLHEIIKTDLESFGEFKVLPPKGMLSFPSTEEEVFYRDWRLLNVDYLVVGHANRSEIEGELKISYFIFDIARERVIHKAIMSGSIKSIRRVAHKMSDKIYKKIQGIPGIFSTRLAYIDKPSADDKNFNLRISDIDGFNGVSLFSSPQPIMSPNWSPLGDKVAYVSFEEGTSRIFIQTISTGTRSGIKLEKGINSSPNWSPKGDKLAAVLSKEGNPDIFLYDLKREIWGQITEHFGIDTEPDWSPDGKSLLFTSNRSGSPQIYQVNVRSKRVKRLTFEGTYNARARYSPDGKSIVFVHRRDGVFHIATQKIRSGKVRILTDTFLDESPTISPNGNVVIYATKRKDEDILAGITIDGKTKFILPSLRGEVREPAWSPILD